MHRFSEWASYLFAATSVLCAELAPIVSVIAGAAATVWTVIRIYEWWKSKRVPNMMDEE
jgi:hypothetical protein